MRSAFCDGPLTDLSLDLLNDKETRASVSRRKRAEREGQPFLTGHASLKILTTQSERIGIIWTKVEQRSCVSLVGPPLNRLCGNRCTRGPPVRA